ncbi:MAG: AAA family ATPase [Candidatus Zixiibacteriota bacterium]|nr:MAG: AAA family ATPase [candidate division Zixibacteria bacterium]
MKVILKSSRLGEEAATCFPDRTRTASWPDPRGGQALLRVDLLDSYREFFKFKRPPFSVCPDPEFFFFSRSAAEALNHLRYGIYEGLGFTMIVGEPGTGKTMLSRYFLGKAGEDLRITHIPDPRLSRRDLLLALMENLGSSEISQKDLTERRLIQQLHDLLLVAHSRSRKVVVFLDEAQGLDFEFLEGLRLISNLESGCQKLIHMVLFGQSELEERLQEKRLRQFDQRVLVRCHLLPLELEEIRPYIQHQLDVAGVDPGLEFSPDSANKVYQITRGQPRMINVLCERALMSAFTQNSKKIGVQNVLEGWESLQGMKILERKA